MRQRTETLLNKGCLTASRHDVGSRKTESQFACGAKLHYDYWSIGRSQLWKPRANWREKGSEWR